MNTPRMRTIKKAISEIQEIDPGTAFTESALRRAIRSGQIPFVTAGNKTLVDLNVVELYLRGELNTVQELPTIGGIRRVS